MPPRDAILVQRAARTLGAGALAEGGAEIHHRLIVVGAALTRRQPFRQGPEFPLHRRLSRPAFDTEATREHALDVAVQNRLALSDAQRQNRPGGGAPDTGQCAQVLDITRKTPAEVIDDELRGTVQVARAGIVTEPGPQVQYLVERRGGERGDIGETIQKTFIIRDYCGHPGLLQHDLGDPGGVRVGAPLPWQILAPACVIPGEHAIGEIGREGFEIHPASEEMERVSGIEPPSREWESRVLPLNYTRAAPGDCTTLTEQAKSAPARVFPRNLDPSQFPLDETGVFLSALGCVLGIGRKSDPRFFAHLPATIPMTPKTLGIHPRKFMNSRDDRAVDGFHKAFPEGIPYRG